MVTSASGMAALIIVSISRASIGIQIFSNTGFDPSYDDQD
jgi:hypothetical protein